MITIIGGSGFVGSFLIKELRSDVIENIDKKISPFYDSITRIGDVRNIDDLKLNDSTKVVVLLAAEHRDDVEPVSLYYDVNVKGTRNVLDSMDVAGVKNLIFTSSVAIYGLNKGMPDENCPDDPFNHYGKSKLEAERIIKEWFYNDPHGKSITIIRPTVIFGERNRGNVYNLLKQISSGRFVMIGDGKNKKSMAYVGNVVSFIKDRIENFSPGIQVYNYADMPDLSMLELTEKIEEKMKVKIPSYKIPFPIGVLVGCFFDCMSILTKKKFSVSSVRIKKFCASTQIDSSKAHRIFNAPFTLEEGLNKTLEHEFIDKIDDNILFYSE